MRQNLYTFDRDLPEDVGEIIDPREVIVKGEPKSAGEGKTESFKLSTPAKIGIAAVIGVVGFLVVKKYLL